MKSLIFIIMLLLIVGAIFAASSFSKELQGQIVDAINSFLRQATSSPAVPGKTPTSNPPVPSSASSNTKIVPPGFIGPSGQPHIIGPSGNPPNY